MSLSIGSWAILTFIGPLLMNLLLLKVNGASMLEETLIVKKSKYSQYIETTSTFLPWFPSKTKNQKINKILEFKIKVPIKKN